jgi:hypothetical protein
MEEPMTRCFAFLLLSLAIATPAAAEPKGGTGTTTVECKEQCQKHCMGNDTPTERANCLAREKCEDRAACPKTSTQFNSGAAGQKVKAPDAKANSQ